ncbi:MAG: hypothetical protein V1753_12375 [Pseudomonadota bacterium]
MRDIAIERPDQVWGADISVPQQSTCRRRLQTTVSGAWAKSSGSEHYGKGIIKSVRCEPEKTNNREPQFNRGSVILVQALALNCGNL